MTKSEIIEARERLEKALETIKKWLPCVDSNLMVYVMIPPALEDMNRELKPLLTHIMDNDDYNLAIKINKDITPVWNDYSDNVNSKRLEASEATWEVNTLIKRLRKWKKEYEEEHPQQPDTPTESPLKKEEIISRTIKESELGKHFNAKFKGAGNNPNYFNNLVADLKDLSTKNDCSAVALMIWDSKTGFINSFSTFAKWCRFFFDCIGVEVKPNYNYSRKVQANDQLKKKFYYL